MTYTSAERNKAINKASTDLLNIISCHDAEANRLVSRVWDRLDRLVAHFERLKAEECSKIAEDEDGNFTHYGVDKNTAFAQRVAADAAQAIRQHSQKGDEK